MINLKPYGAFVEYTIRPLIKDLKKLSKKAGLIITDKTIYHILYSGIVYKLIESITQITILLIIGYLTYAILK